MDSSTFQSEKALNLSDMSSPASLQTPNSKGPKLPSLIVSPDPVSEKGPTSPLWPQQSLKSTSRRSESKKLLSHVLDQLKNRSLPPTVYESFKFTSEDRSERKLGQIVDTVRGAVKLGATKREPRGGPTLADDAEDDDSEDVFSTEDTFQLMVQLKEVLSISLVQGWQFFEDSNASEERRSRGLSPFRRSVNNLPGRRSRSPSPAGGSRKNPDLLYKCISNLSSVVLEDCRFQIASPGPLRPPNALQAITLEVARFLLHVYRHDPRVVCEIGCALIPAFSTFPSGMHARLFSFFEKSVLNKSMEDLRAFQEPSKSTTSTEKPLSDSTQPSSVSIRIDVAEDDHTSTTFTQSERISVLSSNAPNQPLPIYYLTSLVPPLLAAILENVDVAEEDEPRSEVMHGLHRLMNTLIESKYDVYLDVLTILAYHSPKAQRGAAMLLSVYWTRSLGHATISRSLSASHYGAYCRADTPYDHSHPYAHQFAPWWFSATRGHCRACSKHINGFGLFCSLCFCAVHFDCYDYPEGSHVTNYAMHSSNDLARIALFRFSPLTSLPYRGKRRKTDARGHTFHPVNLFSLTLCFRCRQPLWGCVAQAVKCTSCLLFIHPNCASSENLPFCSSGREIDSTQFTIEWSDLQKSCVRFYEGLLSLPKEHMSRLGYEELTIVADVLRIQLQLITNGVGLGSVIISKRGRITAHPGNQGVDEFRLHEVLRHTEECLASSSLPSPSTSEYFQENALREQRPSHLMFDWSYLIFMASTLKTPLIHQKPVPANTSSPMLSVSQPEALAALTSQDASDEAHPSEVVSLGHMIDVLSNEFNIRERSAVRALLLHLHHLGLFECRDVDLRFMLEFESADHASASCVFPLPFGLDLSIDVETLFTAIEACLGTVDLSINEVGFLLLVRRLWPSGMTSEYATRRLARTVTEWIFAEDDYLASILRDYVRKRMILPGVRDARDDLWPASLKQRSTPSSSTNNGGDYVTSRKLLLSQYVEPWMQALHEQDTAAYATLIYELCLEQDNERGLRCPDQPGRALFVETPDIDEGHYCDSVLRKIIRLQQSSVTFDVFDDIFIRWLDWSTRRLGPSVFMSSLLRLFLKDSDPSQRYSSLEPAFSTKPSNDVWVTDVWRLIINMSSSMSGLLRALQWLRIFAVSGIDIDPQIFMQLVGSVQQQNISLSNCEILIQSLLAATWLRSAGRDQLQTLVGTLHTHLAPEITRCLADLGSESDTAMIFIRQSLGICLLFYGCEREKVLASRLILPEEINHLPSRRRLDVRATAQIDPVVIDPAIMQLLGSYLALDRDDVSCIIAKFLTLFLVDSRYLQPHEVDNFIIRNSTSLCSSAWHFFGVQDHEISGLRTKLLIRILVVDGQPFAELLAKWFEPSGDWQKRLIAATRLFRIILDLHSPILPFEDRPWRCSLIDVIEYYFKTMWLDDKEAIRVAMDASTAVLLSSHQESITRCWDEYLLTGSDSSAKARLLSFLLQLHPHFPSWKLISWGTVIDVLREEIVNEQSRNQDDAANLSYYGIEPDESVGVVNSEAGPNTVTMSLLLLSLGMVADGVPIEYNILLTVKEHLVKALGFTDVRLRPSANGQTFFVEFGHAKGVPSNCLACIDELVRLLDSPHSLDLSFLGLSLHAHGQDVSSAPLLVGSPFVDVVLELFNSLGDPKSLPAVIAKNLVESLGIIIYKHDFEKTMLRPWQPVLRRSVTRLLDVLRDETSYEYRHQVLSVIFAYVKRWNHAAGFFALHALEEVAKMIASQGSNTQDALIGHAKSFMEFTLRLYATSGVLVGLMKRSPSNEFFHVLKHVTEGSSKGSMEPLRLALLRDTLNRIEELDQSSFETALEGLSTYVEVVCNQPLPAELLGASAQYLVNFGRRASEFSNFINSTPLLRIAALLLEFNPSNSWELLSSTDALLKVILYRLRVEAPALSRLMSATANVPRRPQRPTNGFTSSTVIYTIFDALSDTLRHKCRLSPVTLKAILKSLLQAEEPGASTPVRAHITVVLGQVEHVFPFLQQHKWSEDVDSEFSAALLLGKFVLQAAEQDPSVLPKIIRQSSDRSFKQSQLIIRAWNIMVLSVLTDDSRQFDRAILDQLPTFSMAHHGVLRSYFQTGVTPTDSAISDINHAYIAIKVWLLLGLKAANLYGESNKRFVAIWNELWPPFHSFVDMLEIVVQASGSTTLATLTWSTVAELFLFLHGMKAPIAMRTQEQTLMLERLKSLYRGEKQEAQTNKLSRTIRTLQEAPPEIGFDMAIDQVTKDIIAAEKLRLLDSARR